MVKLSGIDYDRMVLVDQYYFNGSVQTLFLRKKATSGVDQYFLELYIMGPDGKLMQQGYLYFFINFPSKESKFVGAYINPLYRNNGLAFLLIANWVKLCFDNDIINLKTNRRQKKPLLIYLLKCFAFEIKNLSDYETSSDTITICKSPDGVYRLLFSDPVKRISFLNSSIYYDGGYQVLDELEDDEIVTQILLSKTYFDIAPDKTYKLSGDCILKRERVKGKFDLI